MSIHLSALRLCLPASLAFLSFLPGASRAADDEIWNSRITQAWLDDHVAFAKRTPPTRVRYSLGGTQVWSNGLVPSSFQAFATAPSDQVVGAKLKPFYDFSFLIGTELVRSGDTTRILSSNVNWETSWSRNLQRLGGLKLGVATTGSVGSQDAAYSQSVSGTLGLPLAMPLEKWTMEIRLSPSMSLNTSNGEIGTHLTSEIVSQHVLGSPVSEFKSVLNLKLGYDLAPDTRPAAFAGLEIRITPNL
ncbi:hypothetical protein ACFOYU_12230 [Microvirga sp. GCM10011540]|uniref:hypothetical protein n=1 Tax=Microvirga sp. GCM10011540 TaxID=3317338 RepID=UPI00361229DA